MTSIFFASHLSSIELALFEVHRVLQPAREGALVVCPMAQLPLLDKHLWQKPQLAFVPHAPETDHAAKNMPLMLVAAESWQDRNGQEEPLRYTPFNADERNPTPKIRRLLINLGADVLPFFARFEAMLELIPTTEYPDNGLFPALGDTINAGRLRFRHYRERSYPIQHTNAQDNFAEHFAKWWGTKY